MNKEDKNKNIKKIDEFLDIEGKITFGELEGDFTPEELEAMRQERIEATRKTIEELGIVSKNNMHIFNIETYRRMISIRIKMGRQNKSDEELDAFCIEHFGEPFFKKDDNGK
jgi:hypothetical protein